MKMAREQRVAAGWVECWGLYEYRDGETYWQSADGQWRERKPKRRMGYALLRDALIAAAKWNETVPRRFWRRKKPAAPPPLKVGDEVLVRGKVINAHYDTPMPQVGVEVCGVMGVKSVFVDVGKVVRATKE